MAAWRPRTIAVSASLAGLTLLRPSMFCPSCAASLDEERICEIETASQYQQRKMPDFSYF
jgi:hypothetical protein